MARSMVILRDIPPNKYCRGRDTLAIEQYLELNQRLSITSNGITIAPIKQSEILKQTISRFDVFFMDCLVAKKETIKTALIVIITGQYMP